MSEKFGEGLWERAKALWGKIGPEIAAKDHAQGAVEVLAKRPEDSRAKGAVEAHLMSRSARRLSIGLLLTAWAAGPLVTPEMSFAQTLLGYKEVEVTSPNKFLTSLEAIEFGSKLLGLVVESARWEKRLTVIEFAAAAAAVFYKTHLQGKNNKVFVCPSLFLAPSLDGQNIKLLVTSDAMQKLIGSSGRVNCSSLAPRKQDYTKVVRVRAF